MSCIRSLGVCAGILLQLVPDGARAQEAACRYCPQPAGLQQAAIELGLAAGTGTDGLLFALDASPPATPFESPVMWVSGDYLEQAAGGFGVSLQATGLGLDDADVDLNIYQPGAFELGLNARSFSYRPEAPGQTPFENAGSATPSLPANWVRAGSTELINAVEPDAGRQEPELRRRNVDLHGVFDGGRRWRHTAEFRHQIRDGQDWESLAWLTQVARVPAIVRWTTDELDLASHYVSDNWQARLGYALSWFENQTEARVWPNPYTALSAGADQAQPAPAPDNLAQQLSLSAQYHGVPGLGLSGRLVAGRLEQDADLLMASVNPQLQSALPRATADATVDTLHARVNASYRVTSALRLRLKLHHEGRENDTPVDSFEQIQTDVFISGVRRNLPLSFRETGLQLRADYRLSRLLRLQLGLEQDRRDRPQQARRTTREQRVYADLGLRGRGQTDGSLGLGCGRRSGSALEDIASGEPLSSRQLAYNLADREHCNARVRVAFSPGDNLQADLQATLGSEEYDRSMVGLQDARHAGLTASVAGALRRVWQWQAWLDWSRSTLHQAGSAASSTSPWWATSRDRMGGAGVSLQRAAVLPRLDLELDLRHTRTDGRVAVANEAFPDLRSRLLGAQVQTRYRWRPHVDWIVRYRFERYREDDWQREDLADGSLPNLLAGSVGTDNATAQLLSLSVRYRFR